MRECTDIGCSIFTVVRFEDLHLSIMYRLNTESDRKPINMLGLRDLCLIQKILILPEILPP